MKLSKVSRLRRGSTLLAHLLLGILLFSFSSCSTSRYATKLSSPAVEHLRAAIDSVLLDPLLIPTRVGIKIVSMKTEETLYERDSKILFHPASNLKLLTTATALNVLGKDYQLKTQLYADDQIEDGFLSGNLYAKGFGNPDLTSRDLSDLIQQVKTAGIKAMEGDIVGDVSYFDDLYWGSGWMWDDEPEVYAPFITPLSINKNSVRVHVKPGARIGDQLQINVEPLTSYVSVLNGGITLDDTAKSTLKVSRLFKERLNTITIKGGLPLKSKEYETAISVWRPELYFVTLLKEELERQGISVHGTVRIDTLSRTAKQIASHEWPLDSVLINLNKASDNLSAENTLKIIGAVKHEIPGTTQNGIYAVNEFLNSLGIDTTKYLMVDGSGVSHYNLVTAEIISSLLTAMYHQKDFFDLFYNSLPIAGVDGTLEQRMKGTAATGNLRAKTGTIAGVSSLSGYATTKDGELLAFSIMMQNFIGDPKPYRDAQDKIGILLATFSRQLP